MYTVSYWTWCSEMKRTCLTSHSPNLLALLIISGFFLAKTAYSDVVVIVSIDNPTIQLTKEDVKNIFLGRMTRFPNTDLAAYPAEINKSNREKEIFYQSVANKSITKINRYWARYLFTGKISPPKRFSSYKEIVDLVSNNPSGISYIDNKYISPSVKVVLTLPNQPSP